MILLFAHLKIIDVNLLKQCVSYVNNIRILILTNYKNKYFILFKIFFFKFSNLKAEYEIISRGPKSRAFYRVQATRKLIGGGDIIKKQLEKKHDRTSDSIIDEQVKNAHENTCRIFFDPAHYTVLENVGTFDINVRRSGGPEGLTIIVDYYTEDGTANAESDYIPTKGTLTFYPDDNLQV